MQRVMIAVAAVVVVGCAAEPKLNSEPAVTAKGEVTGATKTVTIGAAGGTISSDDGQLSLVVPAGAVAADTAFTVTPISLKAPGAIVAWRLGPEGTTFTKPASIKITATEAQLLGTDMKAMHVGYQKENGTWAFSPTSTIDGRSITIETPHLSDWAMASGFALKPGQARADLGDTVNLTLQFCNFPSNDAELWPLIAPCQDTDFGPVLENWSVNAIPGGNASVGTIAGGQLSGVYTAPSSKPTSNPVAVSVHYIRLGSNERVILTSNITIAGVPTTYAAQFGWSDDNDNGDGTYLKYNVAGTANFSLNSTSGTASSYDLENGTITSLKVRRRDGNCICEGTTTGQVTDGSLRTVGDGKKVELTVYGSAEIPLACTKIDPALTPPCPTTHSAAVDWRIPDNDPTGFCPTTSNDTFDDIANISGTSVMTCQTPNKDVRGNWTLIGSD